MLKILVVEDDESKREAIRTVLGKLKWKTDISFAHSVRRAIDCLGDSNFDLVVADMSLPTYDIETRERGGTPRPFGGIEVFEYLERIENSIPVVVVTSYPILTDGKKSLSYVDLQNQLSREFPDNYIGLVYYDSTYADWEHAFSKILNQTFPGAK